MILLYYLSFFFIVYVKYIIKVYKPIDEVDELNSKKNSFGNWGPESNSFPFTAPTDGFVYVRFNPSTTSGYQYVVFNVGPVAVKLLTAGGGLTHGVFPVKARETVAIESSTDATNDNTLYRFRSIW